MRKHRALGVLSVAILALGLLAASGQADDRDLLRSFAPRPNVLMVVDSSGSMANDLSDCAGAIAAGDDPHSKMFQVKMAVQWFVHSQPNFNMGFTFYGRANTVFGEKLFLYRVDPEEDRGLDLSWRWWVSPGGSIYDRGSSTHIQLAAGELLRLGDRQPMDGGSYLSSFPGPFFGSDGRWGIADWSTSANNHRIYVNGVRYDGEYRVDAWLEEPVAGTGYYKPAYAWNADVQNALVTFQGVHSTHAATIFDPDQTPLNKLLALQALRNGREVLKGVLEANQIGLEELTVRIRLRQCRNDPDTADAAISDRDGTCSGRWKDVPQGSLTLDLRSAGGLPPSVISPGDTSPGVYPASYMVNEYSGCNYSGMRTDFYSNDTCNGWEGAVQDQVKIPVVPIPTDDDPSLLPLVDLVLRPMGEMQLFFPTRVSGGKYWPTRWEDRPQCDSSAPAHADCGVWVTDRAMYTYGATPIKNSLNDSQQYFEQVIFDRDDPLKDCRKNFVILLTDGLETCSSTQSTCIAARDLGSRDIPVFVIGYGLGVQGNNLRCIADYSRGQLYLPNSLEELVEALRNIGQEIQERLAAFSAPAVPSVELTTREKGYISTFFSVKNRSIWEGHLRGYRVEPTTGIIPATCATDLDGNTLCSPDTSKALWDVGTVLATTSASSRNMFFGTPATGVPGTRQPFLVSGATEVALYNRIFTPSVPVASLTTEQRTELTGVVSFIRGDRGSVDDNNDSVPDYRYCFDPLICDVSGAVGKLGDIFHSVPAITGTPDCFACFQQNYNDYQGFYNTNFWRRKVLFVGADDGAFHGIDAGFFHVADPPDEPDPFIDDGTGKELFAWLPNSTMRSLDLLATTTDHRYTVDGSPVIADVFIDPVHSGTPTPTERSWRTVVMCGMRDGGNSLVALDVTVPDPYDGDGIPQSGSNRMPNCLGGTAGGCSGAYPQLLWEFRDTGLDGNGEPDMAQTWSKPSVGIFAVRAEGSSGDPEYRYVAVFGGGYEPPSYDLFGNPIYNGGDYLYLVDIETGEKLLKLQTGASVTGEVGLLDANFDGIIERVYWNDLAGNLWRMRTDQVASYSLSTGMVPCTYSDANTAACSAWGVKKVFNPGNTAGYQPLFHRPSIVLTGFANGAPLYGVGFGSGDRERILTQNSPAHRFYFVVDPGVDTNLPFSEANLQPIAVESTAVSTSTTYLAGGTTWGWSLVLHDHEKVNTPAVTVSGLLIFSTFTPSNEWQTITDPETRETTCWKRGDAKTYVIDYRNANPAAGASSRYMQFRGDVLMVSEPIVYVGEDGRLHILQSTDNLGISEPVAAQAVPGAMVSWRER